MIPAAGATEVVIDPTEEYQLWEGAGAAITDSSASLFMNAMTAEQRHAILEEMFDPRQGGFSSVRISIGACDFSSQKYYTYDDLPEALPRMPVWSIFDGEGEPGLPMPPRHEERGSGAAGDHIDQSGSEDHGFAVERSRLDEDVESYFGSRKLRLGEYVGNGYRYQDTIDYVYAQYFVKFIAAYAKLGIRISSVTMQNEPSNGCPWPITVWTPEELTKWGSEYLRPAFDRSFPDVEIYFGDDSLRFWQRPVSEYMTPVQAACFAGAAFHTYSGLPVWVHNGTRSSLVGRL